MTAITTPTVCLFCPDFPILLFRVKTLESKSGDFKYESTVYDTSGACEVAMYTEGTTVKVEHALKWCMSVNRYPGQNTAT